MTLMPSSDRDWDMYWNSENRLIVAQSADIILAFSYDYMGRRIEKEVYTGGDGNWALDSHEKFIYDGWNLIAVLDAADSNSVVKTYTWGLDLSQSLQGAGGVGGLLAVTEHDPAGDETYHPTYDANGNVSEYVDDTGTVVAHYEYCPFGQLTVATGVKAADFAHRFSTKYLDSETELYYYGYRYYSAVLGRWISRDPIGEIASSAFFHMGIKEKINAIIAQCNRLISEIESELNLYKQFEPLGLKKGGYKSKITNVITLLELVTIPAQNYYISAEIIHTYEFVTNDAINDADYLGLMESAGQDFMMDHFLDGLDKATQGSPKNKTVKAIILLKQAIDGRRKLDDAAEYSDEYVEDFRRMSYRFVRTGGFDECLELCNYWVEYLDCTILNVVHFCTRYCGKATNTK